MRIVIKDAGQFLVDVARSIMQAGCPPEKADTMINRIISSMAIGELSYEYQMEMNQRLKNLKEGEEEPEAVKEAKAKVQALRNEFEQATLKRAMDVLGLDVEKLLRKDS